MDEYREYVRRLARERTGESFYNNSADHAAVILENLMKAPATEVCFITSALNPSVFARQEVVDAAQMFLSDATHSLRILVETDPEETISPGHPFVGALRQHPNAEMRRVAEHYSSNMNYHFTVANRDSFRFEPDKTKWEASAAFGDEESASKLRDIFDVVWKNSNPVAFPAPLEHQPNL